MLGAAESKCLGLRNESTASPAPERATLAHDVAPTDHRQEQTADDTCDTSVVKDSGQVEPRSSNEDTKAALRNLTLPAVPNLNIPPSPPRSPPAAMSKKVTQFLDLKKQGVHFNEKLARSSAMRNPSLLGKLMTFAGLEPGEQYTSTLSTNLWNPQGFPSWAFKDELGKAQQEAQKKREEDRSRVGRNAADFVRVSEPDQSNDSARPGGRGARESASDRIMTGLSRDRVRTEPRSDRDYRRRSRSPGRQKR